jgi:hypothetical protein
MLDSIQLRVTRDSLSLLIGSYFNDVYSSSDCAACNERMTGWLLQKMPKGVDTA